MFPSDSEVRRHVRLAAEEYDLETRDLFEEAFNIWSRSVYRLRNENLQRAVLWPFLLSVLFVFSLYVFRPLQTKEGFTFFIGLGGVVFVIVSSWGRASDDIRFKQRLPQLAKTVIKTLEEIELSDSIKQFLSTNDPYFAFAVGAPAPQYEKVEVASNVSLWMRIRSRLNTVDGRLTWGAIVVLVSVIVHAFGMSILAATIAILWVLYSVVDAVIDLIQTLRRIPSNDLEDSLINIGVYVKNDILQNLLKAYRSRKTDNIEFWTRRLLSEMKVSEKQHEGADMGKLVLEVLIPFWKEHWGRKMPPGALEALSQYASGVGDE